MPTSTLFYMFFGRMKGSRPYFSSAGHIELKIYRARSAYRKFRKKFISMCNALSGRKTRPLRCTNILTLQGRVFVPSRFVFAELQFFYFVSWGAGVRWTPLRSRSTDRGGSRDLAPAVWFLPSYSFSLCKLGCGCPADSSAQQKHRPRRQPRPCSHRQFCTDSAAGASPCPTLSIILFCEGLLERHAGRPLRCTNLFSANLQGCLIKYKTHKQTDC